MDLFQLEQKIIQDISDTFPYSFSECNSVYQKCLTFDKTIRVLDICKKHGVDTDLAMEVIEAVDNKWV